MELVWLAMRFRDLQYGLSVRIEAVLSRKEEGGSFVINGHPLQFFFYFLTSYKNCYLTCHQFEQCDKSRARVKSRRMQDSAALKCPPSNPLWAKRTVCQRRRIIAKHTHSHSLVYLYSTEIFLAYYDGLPWTTWFTTAFNTKPAWCRVVTWLRSA